MCLRDLLEGEGVPPSYSERPGTAKSVCVSADSPVSDFLSVVTDFVVQANPASTTQTGDVRMT
jgi:hypothetical protein